MIGHACEEKQLSGENDKLIAMKLTVEIINYENIDFFLIIQDLTGFLGKERMVFLL